MNKRLFSRKLKAFLAVIMLLAVISFPVSSQAEEETNYNRFNVMIVLDASSSMDYTDPSHLRYEAISQFINLLAEKGNLLGGIVFSDQVAGQQAPIAADSQESKDQVLQMLKDATTTLEHTETPDGLRYTNIGESLELAVSMLEENGDPNLPSVILLLSDGNTEMPTDEELEVSLEQKAEAIQEARDEGIKIYNVCLNANGRADFSEMEQISSATGGEAREVTVAEDLQDVFNAFYNLIYSTSTIPIVDDVFPDSGRLETEFDVPGLGVEEVNIIIYGSVDNIQLINPDGKTVTPSIQQLNTFAMLKLTDMIPGSWTLVTEGVPGNSIKVNMVYNTNLEIEVNTVFEKVNAGEDWYVEAILKTGNQYATSVSQYEGYEAELQIYDAYGELLDTVPMELFNDSNSFVGEYSFEEGSYFYAIHVKGNYVEKTTKQYGPVTAVVPVAEEEIEEIPENQAPEAIQDRVEKSVYIWPVKGGSFTLDLKTLAEDAEDDTLHYTIVSSSFLEGTDYSIDADNVLTQNHFSLKKGSYTVKATDSGGLSCEIEVVVRTHNVGVMMLIGIGIAVLIGGIILGVLFYLAITPSFKGTPTVRSYVNGAYKGGQRQKRNGRISLTVFGLDNIGLNYSQCYIQASGKKYVTFVSKIPVYHNGNMVKKVRIESGCEEEIRINDSEDRCLYVSFESIIP